MIKIEKYKSRVLGKSNYKDHYIWTLDDFMNKEKLLVFLYELDCNEASLSKAGFLFLKEFYGLKTIIEFIIEEIKEGVDYKYQTEKELLTWLNEMNDQAI